MAGKSPRSRVVLEQRVAEATSPAEQAQAEFALALFHDNNSREAAAIPHYEAALKLGLSGEQRAQCLAWLASSLCKTGKLKRAETHLNAARDATTDPELLKFLQRLNQRVQREATDVAMAQTGGLLMRAARDTRNSRQGNRSGPYGS